MVNTYISEDALPNECSIPGSSDINHLEDARIGGHENPRLA